MKKNTFTSFQWCSALESVNHISWLQYIILLHEVLIQSFRIKFLFVIMGLGLFLKIIFRLTRATISYRVSTWRSSPSTSSSVSIVFSSFFEVLLSDFFFITANGLSSSTIFPTSKWWPMIKCGTSWN